MDKLSGMAVFVRVVEEGGFSAAARVLGVSKSAVSKQVAALEERLGARLLNRTTRRLALTDAGAAYHARASRILAEAEEAEAEVSQLSAAPRGLLRVNAPLTFGVRHLSPLISKFMAQYPDLRVEIQLDDRFVDLVAEGFDVGVRIANLADSSLIARQLCPSRRVLAASPAYLEAHGTPQCPEDLSEHRCLLYSYSMSGDTWRMKGPGGRIATVRVNGPLRANNGDLIRAAAVAGQGIVMSPTFITGEDLAAGRLVRILPEWEDQTGSLFVVWPHARFTPAKVRAFVDFMVAEIGRTPPWEEGTCG